MRSTSSCMMLVLFCWGCQGLNLRSDFPSQRDSQEIPEETSETSKKAPMVSRPAKKMLIFDFWNDSLFFDADFGKEVADLFKTQLIETQRVLISQEITSRYSTFHFVSGDQIRTKDLLSEANRLGFSLALVGKIKKIEFIQNRDNFGIFRKKHSQTSIEIEIKLFDVGSGEEIMQGTQRGNAAHHGYIFAETTRNSSKEFQQTMTMVAAKEALAGFIPFILQSLSKIDWQGRVIECSGAQIYINAGRDTGLILGDILKVFTPGETLYDSETKTYLGSSQGHLKATLEVIEFVGTDASGTRLYTGGNVQVGDIIKLY